MVLISTLSGVSGGKIAAEQISELAEKLAEKRAGGGQLIC